jgi:hypothetical protein
MVEVWLFGRLLATLASAFAVVMVIVALTSITYLAYTLSPVVRIPGADRSARRLGIFIAAGAFLLAIAGLRVGAPGTGELVPTLTVAVAAAAALGSTAAFATLGAARAALALIASRSRRAAEIAARRAGEAKRLAEAKRAFLEGDDLRAQLAEADAAVARLRAALANLAITRDELDARLGKLDQAGAAGDLGSELRRARDEVAAKLDLGEKILHAAEAAAFRIAVGAPIARLLRRRPRVAEGLADTDPKLLPARLGGAAALIDAFLRRAADAHAELATLEPRRPSGVEGPDDPLPYAQRDLEAVESAFRAVRERLDVVRMRLAAQAELDAVASAAGEVSEKVRASGLPAGDLQDLVDEVMRAESAIVMATPTDLDPRALAETLTRGTAALGGHDGASLDELLKALRELA